jgi:hypothetical protein
MMEERSKAHPKGTAENSGKGSKIYSEKEYVTLRNQYWDLRKKTPKSAQEEALLCRWGKNMENNPSLQGFIQKDPYWLMDVRNEETLKGAEGKTVETTVQYRDPVKTADFPYLRIRGEIFGINSVDGIDSSKRGDEKYMKEVELTIFCGKPRHGVGITIVEQEMLLQKNAYRGLMTDPRIDIPLTPSEMIKEEYLDEVRKLLFHRRIMKDMKLSEGYQSHILRLNGIQQPPAAPTSPTKKPFGGIAPWHKVNPDEDTESAVRQTSVSVRSVDIKQQIVDEQINELRIDESMSGSEGEIDERILDEPAVGDEADSDEITVIPTETAIQPSAPNAPTVVQSPSAQGVGEIENKNSGDSFVDESEEDGMLTPYEATEQIEVTSKS